VLDPIGRAGANRNTITLQQSGPRRVPDIGPSRAPGNRVGDRDPITDGGRVMCGLERAVDYNSSPVLPRGPERSGSRLVVG
jgi:hypothetical protein